MRKRHIFIISILALGMHFAFPQNAGDHYIAEAATVPSVNPVIAKEDAKKEEKHLYRDRLAAYITAVNEMVTDEEAAKMVSCMIEQAKTYQLDEKLLMAVAQTESCYNSDAVSIADCKGLMQTSDILAAEAGYQSEDLFHPEISIQIGAEYMKRQMENFDDDTVLALTAYNQGPGSVYEGDYDLFYAEQTMEHLKTLEKFLQDSGFREGNCIQS